MNRWIKWFGTLALYSVLTTTGLAHRRLVQTLAEMEPPVAVHPDRGDRSRSQRTFPDGSRIVELNFAARKLLIAEADGTEREVPLGFSGYATTLYVLHAGPDGRIYGSSDHPSYLYIYDPATDELMFYPERSINFKALRVQGNYLFGATYTGGYLWILDTSKPITMAPAPSLPDRTITVAPAAEGAAANPVCPGMFASDINIPRGAFAHPDGRHILISGQPGYGFVGGGIGIYDLETKKTIRLNHRQLLADYSTMAMAALPDGSLLCGTSPLGGHGTSPVHGRAQLYILDWPTKQVAWQSGPLPHAYSILSLLAGPDGRYYYVTDKGLLVVIELHIRPDEPDPLEQLLDITAPDEQPLVGGLPPPAAPPPLKVSVKEVHRADLSEHGGHTLTQAMIWGPDGKIYLGLPRALLRITPGTFATEILAQPASGVSAGLGIVNGRLYFAGGGRVHSLAIPPPGETVAPDAIVNHGAPVTSSENRGMTAAIDGDGNRVVLVWLMNGGTDKKLVINVDTGESRVVPVEPFAGDNAFSVWHSSRNRWYSHYGGHFYEFDPQTLGFSFAAPKSSRCAMSMHEDHRGIIWAALYPGAGLLSFDPETRELTDHGSMHREGWAQYPTYMAVDDAGWVYIGLGNTLGQLVAYHPATGDRRAFVPQADRQQGVGRPFTATDGRVYATAPGWRAHELFAGEATPVAALTQRRLAQQAGDYHPDRHDYFMPALNFRNWLYVEPGAGSILDELLGGAMQDQPAIVRAPTGLAAEADRWLWKSDLDDRFELLIRGRNGFEEGTLRVTLNDRELFKAAPPFPRDGSSIMSLSIPNDLLREIDNRLTIGFTPDKEPTTLDQADENVPMLTVYYAVFKRLPRPPEAGAGR